MLFETNRSIDKNYIYTQTDDNLTFVSHVHSSYEFITVFDGELECIVYHERVSLTPGKAMLIMPNTVHSYRTVGSSKSFLCVFSSDYIADFYNDANAGVRGGGVYALFDFDDCNEIALLKDKSTNKYMLKSVLYGFCGAAVSHIVKGYDKGADGELSVKLLYYIQDNYDKPISLKIIAGEMGYNYTYLSNMFNKIFGCGFSKFVNRFRVENAAELLRTTDMSMVQISNACGFESIRSFNEQFKLDYGVTPTDYRAQQRK